MVVTRACEKVQGDIIKIDILKKATTPRSRSGALKAGGHTRARSEKRKEKESISYIQKFQSARGREVRKGSSARTGKKDRYGI